MREGESFEATIDVDSVTNFNSGLFDLSFDSSVVKVTDVVDGHIAGETIPVDRWDFIDENTIRVPVDMPGIKGISGSGYLAKVIFRAVEKEGEKSVLDISNGMLANNEAEEIPAVWIDGEIRIGTLYDTTPPKVTIISPEEGMTYATTEIAMEVTANEPIAKWSYNLNGAGNVTFTPDITITAREGDNSLVVFAKDIVWNIGSSTVSFVVDTIPPVVICPTDVTVELETIVGTVVTLEVTATNNCDLDPIITSNELDIYPLGTTTVTFTATDASGNSASCSTNVAVVDTTPPEITDIMVSPSIASPGTPITISAKVFDLSMVSSAKAYIYKGGEPATTVFMSDPDKDGIYTGTWRTMIFTEGGIYNITISATNTEGNEALKKAPGVEIPIDTEGPLVSDITVSPTSAEPGTSIHTSAKLYDNLSGIEWVKAIINKGGRYVTTVFMSDPDKDGIYTGTWHTTTSTVSGIYNINISAADNRGNEALAKGPEIEIT